MPPRGGRRRAGRRVPDRRLPDGIRNVVEHERQRGDRRASPRPNSVAECTPTTTSISGSHPTTSSRPCSTSRRVLAIERRPDPGARSSARSLARKADEFDDMVKIGRTHLMDAVPIRWGRNSAATPRRSSSPSSASRRRCRGLRELPSGAPRSAPGSTRTRVRRDDGTGAREADRRCRSARRENHFEAKARVTPSLHCRGACRARRGADEDRQRYSAAGLRTAGRTGRAGAAGHPAGQLDHAGQGQSGYQRGRSSRSGRKSAATARRS